MQIFALLAALGAALGQPDGPLDQDAPSAEQQQADAAYPAGQPPAEEPEVNTNSNREEQPAERQEADTSSAAAAEQPAETGSNEAGAELDAAIPDHSSWEWWRWPRNGLNYFRGRDNGPFTVTYVYADHRAEQLRISASVQGSPSPEQWGALEEQARTWICGSDAAGFTRGVGDYIVLTLHGENGLRRTLTITDCRPR